MQSFIVESHLHVNCGKKISNKGNLTKHMKIHNKHDPLGIEEAEFVIDSQADMFA